MHALDNPTNKTNDVLLTSLFKAFALFMVKFDCKQTGTGQHLVGLAAK